MNQSLNIGLDDKEAANLPAILPYRWDGSHGYVVGPFEKQQVAAYFAQHIASPALASHRIVELTSQWYLDARFEGVFGAEARYERRSKAP